MISNFFICGLVTDIGQQSVKITITTEIGDLLGRVNIPITSVPFWMLRKGAEFYGQVEYNPDCENIANCIDWKKIKPRNVLL